MLSSVRRDPYDLAERKVEKAFALQAQGKLVEAEQLVQRYAERRPRDPQPELVWAALLNGRMSHADAATHALRAAELDWDNPSVVFRAANTAVYGDLDSSIRLVARVEELLRVPGQSAKFPFHDELLRLNGLIALFSGETRQARAMFTLAYETDPTMLGLGYELAYSYFKEDLIEEAAAVVADALTYHPHDERLRELEARIEERRRRPE